MVDADAVLVILKVYGEAFEAIRLQASEAYDHRRIMHAKVALIRKSLPDGTNSPSASHFALHLGDLDESTMRGYGFREFEISNTRYFDHIRGRVLKIERERNEGYGTYISILLTVARYKVHVELALFHSISCKGRVVDGRGKPYDGADVTVEFGEHEANWYDEVRERGFFGEFSYYSKVPDEEYSSTHFDFHLRHLPEDTRDFLFPLLTKGFQNQVILTVNLTKKEGELLAEKDKLSGNVRHYSFEVRQHLVNDHS